MKQAPRMAGVFFCMTLLLCRWPALAQDQTPLTLAEAVQLALTNNRRLQAVARQSEAAASGVGQARGAFFPRLDLVEGFTYSDKPTLVFSGLLDQASFKQRNFAIGSLNEPPPLTNLSSQIRLEQPLYTGGRLSANLRQAQLSAEASEDIKRRAQQDVVFRATEAYYQALLADGNLEVVERALASARAHRRRAEDLFQKGLTVRSDFLRAEVLVGGLEREKMEAENLVAISRARLRHVLGIETEKFRLTERVNEDRLPLEDFHRLVAVARSSRPDLKAAEKDVEKATESMRAARADYYPALGFVTQFEGNTRKFSTSGESFAVFITARWNLFNGFATQEKEREARALTGRARLLRDDLLQAIAVEVEEAYLGLRSSRRQVAVASQNVDQAAESLRIVKDRYEVGLAKSVDVVDGEAALKRAEQDLLQARINSQIFRARLNLATGALP
ncbi:MAG TPA: TolC family protein [candidate division Zixibacteria bacterium]|nr:TolC family protein [candidate division Zixibacteria bacterium]